MGHEREFTGRGGVCRVCGQQIEKTDAVVAIDGQWTHEWCVWIHRRR